MNGLRGAVEAVELSGDAMTEHGVGIRGERGDPCTHVERKGRSRQPEDALMAAEPGANCEKMSNPPVGVPGCERLDSAEDTTLGGRDSHEKWFHRANLGAAAAFQRLGGEIVDGSSRWG